MASIRPLTDLDLDDPVLVEGLPGVGLVGKIAVDHLVDRFAMTYCAGVRCEGLPRVAVYGEQARSVRPPVRLYVDEDRDLLALQSDVPVSRTAGSEFADLVTEWVGEVGALPIYLSGMGVDQDPGNVPEVFGVAAGDAASVLDDHGIDEPSERGVVGGPTGALLDRAADASVDAACLVVESDPQFPDPAASRRLLVEGIEPIADVSVDTDDLVERAEQIRDQKEGLARKMQQADEEESSQAKPMRMFQ